MLVNNSYIFEPIFILTTQSCCAVCPLVECKRLEESIKHQESMVDETWAILKNYINSLEKCRYRKVCSLITPTFLNQFLFWQRSYVVQYVLLWNAKGYEDPIKHQESIVDETWAILKNSFNSLEKCRCRKVCSLITPIFLNQFLFWQRSQFLL